MTFAYTESTNTVVATNGTSGTPLTFAHFVTADRANSAELLAAEACTTNHTLTYQIRPVEDLALQISFVLSGTSAGAGDTLDVTGTDWDGNAQGPESIDVSAGDGTYNGANKWRTITDIDCTGWADGTLQVTQPIWGVIWDYGNGQYELDAKIMWGNGATATHFRSDNECIMLNAEPVLNQVTANATLYSGILTEGMGVNGSTWNFNYANHAYLGWWAGTVIFYGVRINIKTTYRLYTGNGTAFTLMDSTINFETGTTDVLHIGNNQTITRANIASFDGGASANIDFQGAPTINSMTHNIGTISNWSNSNQSASDMNLLNTTTQHLYQGSGQTITLTDSNLAPTLITIGHADGIIYEKYTINIHVADKDGANLATVAVLCEDTDGNTTGGFTSVNTDASGDIAEQTIIYKQWTTTSETLKTYSPHKFTISKAGYETLILDNITVDTPIVWHLELQAQKQSPAPWQEGMM